MAPQRKALKGVQRVVESMTVARKKAPPQRKASKGAQQVRNTRKVRQRMSTSTSPGAFNFDTETIRTIMREVTENIKAHVDDRLDNIFSSMQPMHQAAVTADPAPVASTSQQRTREVANLLTSQLGTLSSAASTSQLGNHKVVNQAVDIATSALVGNTGLDPPSVQISPNYSVYNVTEGTQNFVFTCNIIEANPLPQSNGYSWFHKSVVIQGQVSSSYTIPSVQKSDDGEYKCTAKNDYDSGTSNSLALNVQYPPSIQVLTSPYKVIESQPLNVTCQASCIPPPDKISWSPSGEGSVPSILYISSVSRNKSGTYSCTAQNTMTPTVGVQQTGMNTSQIHVDVLYPPYMWGMNSSYKVIENQPLNVTCRVSSNPPPDKVSWSPTGEGSVPSSLYFSSVSRNNSRTYSCTAQNTMTPTVGLQQAGMNTRQIQVDVLYTAKITEFVSKGNITEIMENGTFQLYCHVDSNPFSEISLIFSDVLVSVTQDSSELIYSAIAGCLDAGKYICSATNSVMNGVTVSAEINLKVQCHPRLDFRKKISVEYYRAMNDIITLNVSIIAYPEPINIMWYRRAAETDIWERVLNQSFSSIGLHSDISVHLGSDRDFGDYLVNMSNSFGIFELIFHVIPEKGTPQTLGIPVAGIAGGVSAGFVLILVMGLSIFLWRRSQQKKQNEDENEVTRENKERSVRHDAVKGQEYEGLHLNRGEASPYLQLNDITLEENRNANTRPPENDSYEKLHPYTNTDIQMYSSLKIPKISKDSVQMYENTQIM